MCRLVWQKLCMGSVSGRVTRAFCQALTRYNREFLPTYIRGRVTHTHATRTQREKERERESERARESEWREVKINLADIRNKCALDITRTLFLVVSLCRRIQTLKARNTSQLSRSSFDGELESVQFRQI